MIFSWWKQKRRQVLREQPTPPGWESVLRENVSVYARLSAAEQIKLRREMQVFIAEKNWEGCQGLEITEEIKVTIAAQACLLVLGFEGEYFDKVKSILVYPRSFVIPGHTVIPGGVVLERRAYDSGEAWYRGPVILSWEDVVAGGQVENDGHNVVLHEFAHQLDMQNGRVVDGIPELETPQQDVRWNEVMNREYQRLKQDCRSGRPNLLDCYGTENMGEFFAVATESFFEEPREMSASHSDMYEIFREFYKQDPAERW